MKDRIQRVHCLHCRKAVSLGAARVFQGVTVCQACHDLAARIVARGREDLERLHLLLIDKVRVALLEGRLQLPASGLLETSPTAAQSLTQGSTNVTRPAAENESANTKP
jgi:hypothetical protein